MLLDFSFVFILVIITESLTYLFLRGDIFFNIKLKISSICKFLEDLLSCSYCFSFWVSFGVNFLFPLIVGRFPVQLIDNVNIFMVLVNYILSVIIIQRLSNYLHGFKDKFMSVEYDIRFNKET